MQKLKTRWDLASWEIRMRPQPQTGIGRGIGFGVASKLNVSLYIPQHTEVAITHGANALREFEQVPLIRRRSLQDTGTINHQVIEELKDNVITL